ncbi:MAG: sensor domain-containing diguanylate cyclase [Sulfobacillus acidophilus]|uniref:Sensor domain-containing diguanylate cyclase n=1 Tax=Sulfobacillus acidophilus TaxID=53633 RepID=A0A2T2WCP0_9FIRM|nr:MAG: sensor domain-containing diguanylate cyclase [Sulfobacillus acidophilus]
MDDGLVWVAVLCLAVLGAIFWQKLHILEITNQVLIVIDLILISVAIRISGGLASPVYIVYGGEAVFLTAYGTLRYSAAGVVALILAYGLATDGWDTRTFWWRVTILGLYLLAAGGLGYEYRRTRSRSRENYLVLQQLSRLRTLQDSIVEERDIDVVLTRLLAEARETTHAKIAYLVRLDDRGRIQRVVTNGITLPETLDYSQLQAPSAFQVLGDQDEGAWADPVCQQLWQSGMRTLALMPLRQEEILYGWMGLATDRSPSALNSQELIIRSLADVMSTQMKFYASQMVAAKRGQLLTILERVSRIVNRNLDMEQLLRSLREAVAQVLEIDSFFVVLTLPDDSSHAFMQYLWDDGVEYPSEVIDLDPQGLTGRVIVSGEPLLLGEGVNEGKLTGSNKAPRGMIFVPLAHEGRVLGAMSVQSYRIEYDPEHVEFLSVIAAQASVAIRNAQMYQQSQEIALTDHLTELGNSRRFDMALQSTIEVAEELQQPLALLLIDSDSLKIINDRFGHRAGDLHLQRLAEVIRDNIREDDRAFRYAGDEFVVILPKTDIVDAIHVGERIRHELEVRPCVWRETFILRSTISVGAAAWRPGMTADSLFQAADRAMYEAKKAGKNRVAQA